MKLSVVIPVYNEEEIIQELYRRIKSAMKRDFSTFVYEIVLVDDGSRDNTFEQIKQLHRRDKNVKGIQFSRNFGHHIAITAGLDYSTGDYVVMMDGDLQDQPEEIIKLYKKLQKGFDVVYAIRQNKQFGWFKRSSSSLFNSLIRRLINEDIIINSTIFRIMRRDVVKNILELRETNRYVIGIIGWVGFSHAGQPVIHGRRFQGKTKYNLSKQFSLASNAIFSFSNYPLHLITRIGFLFVFLSFVMIVYIFVRKILYNIPVVGWASLFTAVLILGGIQIILLGIIGEYVGRSYMELKNRPLYIVKEKLD